MERWAIIERFVTRLRALGKASFTAVTDATELDAYGPPAPHDRRRIYADRSGSFERIAANA